MYDDENDEQKQNPRRSLPLLAIVLLLCILSFVVWLVLLPRISPVVSNVSTATPAQRTITLTQAVKDGEGDPPIYWQTIKEEIAKGLHLSVSQVVTKLQPAPDQRDSPGIASVARQQHIVGAQWRTIEINAIQKGHDLLVRMHILTKTESDQGMGRIKKWDQANLDDHVTGWFLYSY